MQIRDKKDAEAQSKHSFILHVKRLHVSALYSHNQAEHWAINRKKIECNKTVGTRSRRISMDSCVNNYISIHIYIKGIYIYIYIYIKGDPLATEPGIFLIILTPMKTLQRNWNRSTFVVWEMKRGVSVVCICFVAISSLELELLKKGRVRQRVGQPVKSFFSYIRIFNTQCGCLV